jgi:hypothetical protein
MGVFHPRWVLHLHRGPPQLHQAEEQRTGNASGWLEDWMSMKSRMPGGVRWSDLFLAGSALALTTVALLAWATQLELRAGWEAARLAELDARRVMAAGALAELERRAGEDAALRQAVAQRLDDLRARYPARFSKALAEASRARPKGVWLTRFHWTGAEVKAEGRAWGRAPAVEFAGRLARSPHFAQVITVPIDGSSLPGVADPEKFLLLARAVARG